MQVPQNEVDLEEISGEGGAIPKNVLVIKITNQNSSLPEKRGYVTSDKRSSME